MGQFSLARRHNKYHIDSYRGSLVEVQQWYLIQRRRRHDLERRSTWDL